jgi:pyruvate dehydrogenase E1 component alpha subunit
MSSPLHEQLQKQLKYPTVSYLNEKGDLSPSCHYHIDDAELIKGYRTMLLTRLVDERMITLQRQGIISFALSSLGEEACSVASAAALQMEDWLYPQYRESGILFWRGFTIEEYLNQMFGNAKDLILGRQMPNHFGSRALNVVHVSSPIGTKIPHAAGCAYGMKLQKERAVAVSYFGEGATSEGDFHTGLNFAAVRKAPAIFFCRNNRYAISTPCSEQFACEGIAQKGIGYGIPAMRIDGNDYFAVHEAVSLARQGCIEGKGPYLIEAMTYRLGAHSTSDDPTLYRADAEVEEWKLKCPLKRLKSYLEKRKLWDENEEKNAQKLVTDQLNAAIAAVKQIPKPPLHTLIEHVYFDIPSNLQRQYEQLKNILNEGSEDHAGT